MLDKVLLIKVFEDVWVKDYCDVEWECGVYLSSSAEEAATYADSV